MNEEIATPINAVYGLDGSVLATNKKPKEKTWPDITKLKSGQKVMIETPYIIDEFDINDVHLVIAGAYSRDGEISGIMYIADEKNLPASVPNPDEETAILFRRLCQLKGIKTNISEKDIKEENIE